MTTKTFQKGDVLDWTNGGSAKSAGAVVELKHNVGIALTDIAGSAVGAVAVEGVFLVAKATGQAWLQGEKLLWDTSAQKFDYSGATPASGDIMGAAIAFAAAASGDTTGYVKLTPGNCTLS